MYVVTAVWCCNCSGFSMKSLSPRAPISVSSLSNHICQLPQRITTTHECGLWYGVIVFLQSSIISHIWFVYTPCDSDALISSVDSFFTHGSPFYWNRLSGFYDQILVTNKQMNHTENKTSLSGGDNATCYNEVVKIYTITFSSSCFWRTECSSFSCHADSREIFKMSQKWVSAMG